MAEDVESSQTWKLHIRRISLPSSLLPRHCRTQSLGHKSSGENHHVVATLVPSFIVPVARKVGTFAGNAMFLMGALKGTGGTDGVLRITWPTGLLLGTGLYVALKNPKMLTSHNTWTLLLHATSRCLRLQKVLYESKLAHDLRVDSGNPCAQQLLPAHGYIQCTSVSFSNSRETFMLSWFGFVARWLQDESLFSGFFRYHCRISYIFIQHASLWTLWRNRPQATWVQHLIARICLWRLLPAQAWGVGQDGWFYAFGSHLGCSAEIRAEQISTLAECRLHGQQQNMFKNTQLVTKPIISIITINLNQSKSLCRRGGRCHLTLGRFLKCCWGNVLMIIQGIAQVLSSLAVVEISPDGYEASVQLGTDAFAAIRKSCCCKML